MNCRRCGGGRLAGICAKCSDLCSYFLVNDEEKSGNGYVPGDMGIGGGDYVEFSFCLDCGQIQTEFPVPETALEQLVPEEPLRCQKCNSDHVFEYIPGNLICHDCGDVSSVKGRR
jgi:hypothetical protein